LPFFKETKARVNVIKIKAEVKLLGAELGKGGEGKLRVKARLFSDVESCDVWTLIALNNKQRLV
jgi:hypothetical protein